MVGRLDIIIANVEAVEKHTQDKSDLMNARLALMTKQYKGTLFLI
jgi:hypothetical protein